MTNLVFGKEAQRHQTCDNWPKKKLSSVGAELSRSKMFFKKSTGNKMNATELKMRNPGCLGRSIIKIRK